MIRKLSCRVTGKFISTVTLRMYIAQARLTRLMSLKCQPIKKTLTFLLYRFPTFCNEVANAEIPKI